MSNAIRYDSLLLAALARSLDRHFAGRSVRGIWLDRADRSLLIRLAAHTRRSDDTFIHWRLHPTSGDLTVSDTPRAPAGSTVQVAPGTSLTSVRTLPDERVLLFDLDARDAAPGFTRSIVVELIGSRWNALALGGGGAITALLQLRGRNGTMLRPGASYIAPDARHRAGADAALSFDEFARIMSEQRDDDIRRALVNDVAYTSPMNATYIVAPLVHHIDADTLQQSWERYNALRASDDGVILHDGRGQPYPSSLGRADFDPAADLIDAFNQVALRNAETPADAPAAGSVEAAMAAVHERMRRIDERVNRLAAESRDAEAESHLMRRQADLLFAQLHRAQRGVNELELDDFEGGTLHVTLDPQLGAKENATKWYEHAKRRDHAAERVPAMIARAQTERARLQELQDRLRAGAATTDEIARWSKENVSERAHDETTVLPYKRYRTTGGLEVRVGRNSKANDQLTFHHASPSDIWLHARDLAGAHVVLRWNDRDANPPARDIAEAAALAALHSRGRTSGMVPVDWTRRKYVRKPRKSPPGRVVIERAKTVFAEPDARLDRALRDE